MPLSEIIRAGAGEMTLWVNCLPLKQDYLNRSPQTYVKSQVCWCSTTSRCGVGRWADRRILGTSANQWSLAQTSRLLGIPANQ